MMRGRLGEMLQPASRLYVAALFLLTCVLVGVTAYVLAFRPIAKLNGRLDVVQHEVLEVPCLHRDAACRNFLSLLIANATRKQIRHLLREAHRLRRHPTAGILRGAKQVNRHRNVVRHRHHRVQKIPTLKPQPPTRLPAHHHRHRHRHRPVRGGGSPGNGPPPGHGNGLPGRPGREGRQGARHHG